MTPALATTLLIEFNERFDGSTIDKARDIAFRDDGFEVNVEARDRQHLLRAVFDSGYDATRAALAIINSLEVAGRGGAADRQGMRVLLFPAAPAGGEDGGSGTADLLGRVGAGQIIVTAAIAIVIGPTLPRGVNLRYQGVWSPEPDGGAERLYELCFDTTGAGSTNLDWARRTAVPPVLDPRLNVLVSGQNRAGGSLRTVLVSGEAAERTALCAELALRVHAVGSPVLHGRWERTDTAPFAAFRAALGSYADTASSQQLRADLLGHLEDVILLMPELGARLGAAPADPVTPWRSATRTADALSAWLHQIATRQQTLLILEDLPAADTASTLLLRNLWFLCGRQPLTVVCTAGGDAAEAASMMASWAEAGSYSFEQLRV